MTHSSLISITNALLAFISNFNASNKQTLTNKKQPFVKQNMKQTGVAGMCSKTTVAPLDRIKILLQAHSVHYKHLGVFSGLRHIVRRESFFALYKGNGAQMVRIFPYAATQFTAFEIYKKVCYIICIASIVEILIVLFVCSV